MDFLLPQRGTKVTTNKGSQSNFIVAFYLFLEISGKQSFELFDSDRFRNKIFYS